MGFAVYDDIFFFIVFVCLPHSLFCLSIISFWLEFSLTEFRVCFLILFDSLVKSCPGSNTHQTIELYIKKKKNLFDSLIERKLGGLAVYHVFCS